MNKYKYLLLALLVIPSSACRRDMQSQPKVTPLKRSWFYPDGRSARPVPPGTISVDEVNIDPAVDTGSVNGSFVQKIPIPVTSDLLKRGQNRFDIYCAPCHAATGFGNGMIADRGFKTPANLNGERIRGAPAGYIYQVIVKGFGGMGPYAFQIKSVRDRWAVVAYIRALELSRYAPLSDVPAKARSRLEAQR
ncbi:MAG TPA: cytochrome c [Bryobacteraceae bacterium]